ncbi:hypothetical protein GCM10027521_19370 [Amycolatopsis cihanbeyliensis]
MLPLLGTGLVELEHPEVTGELRPSLDEDVQAGPQDDVPDDTVAAEAPALARLGVAGPRGGTGRAVVLADDSGPVRRRCAGFRSCGAVPRFRPAPAVRSRCG